MVEGFIVVLLRSGANAETSATFWRTEVTFTLEKAALDPTGVRYSGFVKFLAALIVLTNIALADAPPGHYRLTPRGWLEVYQPRETRLPSCGRDVVDFIASFDHLEIEIGSAIKVNGSVWTSSQRLPDGRMMAVRDDLLEGYSVGISVRRDGRDADGFLVVVGRRDDGESCGDARGFAGRYAR